ncbi:prepilin peptidase [Acetobacterium wieringae]|uniref:Prepilin peptidase n=1 Tax=Acetobacterium wieringae TaxID=52694 RepID=A0ABY6HJ49_9FIRM|nr:prepilin peptidase [Acetobacterium wieringae]UYO64412.1 prepilin peptidase [Acetobacterium wieringae]VUZ25212.1 Uncharacterised protein [Acetobacterium wieringae]
MIIGVITVTFFWTTFSELLKEELQFALKNTYLIIGCFIFLSYLYGAAFALRVCLFLTIMLYILVYDTITKTIPSFTHWIIVGIGLIDLNQAWLFGQALPGLIIPAVPIFIFNNLLKNKIGLGDIKLMASCGFVVGMFAGYFAILLACFMALLLNRKEKNHFSFAFAPYLCMFYLLFY